jgi:O-antigen/teichoic acid export membrane protein
MQASRRGDALWMLSGGLAQAGLAFGANLALARLLAPADFGRFALLSAGLALFGSLASLRLPTLLLRGAEPTPERLSRLVNASRFEALLLFAAGLLLLLSGALPRGTPLALWLLLLTQAAQPLVYAAQALGERRGHFRPLARLETLAQISGHGLALLAAWAGLAEGALALREAWILGALALGLSWLGCWPRAPWRLPRWSELLGLADEARDVWLDGLLESAYARVLTLGAGLVGGETGAGLYHQAMRLAQVPHQLLQPVAARLAFNWFARDGARRDATLRHLGRWLAAPLALCFLLCLLAAEPLVPWMLGERWRGAGPLLAALSGVAAGQSLLSLGKMALLAGRQSVRLLCARLFQWTVLLGLLPLAIAAGNLGLFALAVSLSTLLAAGCAVRLALWQNAPAALALEPHLGDEPAQQSPDSPRTSGPAGEPGPRPTSPPVQPPNVEASPAALPRPLDPAQKSSVSAAHGDRGTGRP